MRRTNPSRAPARQSVRHAAVVFFAVAIAGAAHGQSGFQPPTAESEVSRRFDQVEALLADSLWDEAIDLIETIQAEHGRLLIEMVPDRFLPVAHKCQQLLCGLPSEGLTAYRRRTDSTAARLLAQGVETLDTKPLRLVAEEMLATSSGADAAIALAELAMSRADTVEARRWLLLATRLASGPRGEPAGGVLSRVDPAVAPEELADAWRGVERPGVVAAAAEEHQIVKALTLLATCAIREGDARRASAIVRLLNAVAPSAEGRIAGKEQPVAPRLARLINDLPQAAETSADPGVRSAGPLVAWQWAHQFEAMQRARQALLAQRNRQRNFMLQQQRFALAWERHPISSTRTVPTLGSDRVLWVESGKLLAVDSDTGTPTELSLPNEWTSPVKDQQAAGRGAQDRVRIDDGIVIRQGRARVLNSRGRLVDLPLPVVTWVRAPRVVDDVVYGRINRRVIEVQSVNRRRSVVEESIVGIDLAREGKLVFDLSTKDVQDDTPATFVSQPVVEGDRVYAFVAPRTNRGAVSIVCYSRTPQRRLWSTPIGAGSATNVAVDLVALERRGDALFCCTGNGALAALDRRTGRLRWVTRYVGSPTTPKLGPAPRQLAAYGGLLIAAPADSDQLIALDSASGAVLWTTPRDPRSELLHSGTRTVVLAGERIAWHDPLSGQTLRRFPDSLHSGLRGMGRAAICSKELFWPTRDSIMVFDVETGRFTRPEIPLQGFVGEGADTYAAGDNLLVVGSVTMALRGAKPMPTEPALGLTRPKPYGDPLVAALSR